MTVPMSVLLDARTGLSSGGQKGKPFLGLLGGRGAQVWGAAGGGPRGASAGPLWGRGGPAGLMTRHTCGAGNGGSCPHPNCPPLLHHPPAPS